MLVLIGAGVMRYPFIAFCAVFSAWDGVPLCPTGVPRICVRQAVRDKHVVGAHAGTCSGCRCPGVVGLLAWLVFGKSEPHAPFGL